MTKGPRALLVVSILVALGLVAFLLTHSGGAADTSTEGAGSALAKTDDASPAGAPAKVTNAGEGDDAARAAAQRTELDAPKKPVTATSAKIALTGRLCTPSNHPVAGQRILHRGLPSGDGLDPLLAAALRDARQERSDPSLPKTDAEGRFRIEVKQGEAVRLELPDEEYVFRDTAEASRTKQVAMRCEASQKDRDLGAIVVVPAAGIAGVVRDGRGQPIEGARVSVTREPAAALLFFGGEPTTRSDKDGKFAVRGLPAGTFKLDVSSPRHVPWKKSTELREGERRQDEVVELSEGLAIAGMIVDDLGKPIVGANVSAQRKTTEGSITIENMVFGGRGGVKTDANGSFVLTGLDDPIVTVNASAKGHGRARQADVAVGANDLVLRLARVGAIEGVLVDTTGAPLKGSEVRATRSGSDPNLARFGTPSKTAADGTFRVEDVEPGTLTLVAEGDTHRPTEPVKVDVRPGETSKGVRIVAETGAIVAALVLDTQGEPVEGALVEVRKPAQEPSAPTLPGPRSRSRKIVRSARSDGASPGGFASVVDAQVLGSGKTDKEGKVSIGGLPAGAVLVAASHKTFASAKPLPLALPEAGTTGATLRVRKGGSVEISVVDADRLPLKTTKVRVEGPLGVDEETEQKSGTSDESGRTTLGPLAPGSYRAFIVPEPKPLDMGGAMIVIGDEMPLQGSKAEFTIAADAVTKVTVVQPMLASVRGTISNVEGPVAGASIELTSSDQPAMPGFGGGHNAKSDKEGRFAIEGVPPGSYVLAYGKKNALLKHEETLEIPSGQRDVLKDLVLHGSSVQVLVLGGQDATPLRGAKVSIERAGDPSKGQPARRSVTFSVAINQTDDAGDGVMKMSSGESSVLTDDEGKALLKDLPGGRYRLVVEHGKHAEHRTEPFDLASDAKLELGSVKLAAGGAISGTIKAAGDEPMMFAMVEIWQAGAEGRKKHVPAMGGTFRQPGLAPGKYQVKANQPKPDGEKPVESATQEVEVKAGETVKVALELR